MNLTNKKVLITGATGGIGNCLVKKFDSLNTKIIATGTNEEKLNNLKKNFPNLVELDYIGQTQKGKKIPIVYLCDKSFKDSKKIRIWMQGGSHGNEPASTETLLFLIHCRGMKLN